MSAAPENTDATPPPAATLIEQAFERLQLENLDAAAALLERCLQGEPGHADALHLLGIVRGQQSRLDDAVGLFDQVLALEPDNAAAHHNRGNAMGMLGRWDDALSSLERCLALQPANVDARLGLARVLIESERPLEALVSLDQALAITPENHQLLRYRGELYARYRELWPDWQARAADDFRRAMAQGGDRDDLGYYLGAIGVQAAPPKAPRQFVVELFDHYADNFEKHLVERLAYKTPELIAGIVGQLGLAGPVDVLDLGCGTGLCAQGLRPLARRLAGVDLSPQMLAKAAERGSYDELACADIEEYLHRLREPVDLMVAADVFIYFGELQGVFAGAARGLRAGGRLIFSVERHEGEGYLLHSMRRYAHADAYITGLAQAHGFTVERIDPVVLRQNLGTDVWGALVVLRKGSPS